MPAHVPLPGLRVLIRFVFGVESWKPRPHLSSPAPSGNDADSPGLVLRQRSAELERLLPSDGIIAELAPKLAAAPRDELTLPCHQAGDADLWFADSPVDLEKAKALCLGCPVKAACLAGAQRRGEPWGVWGGEIFERGEVIARKRPRGRSCRTRFSMSRMR